MSDNKNKPSELCDNRPKVGSVAVVGVPNAGKSTLVNTILGAKLSIVSKKAQTTRHKVLGIYSDEQRQIKFLDTPGFQLKYKSVLNSAMNKSVSSSITEVDIVIFVIEAGLIDDGEIDLIKMLPKDIPVLCAISKIDRLPSKNALLPFIEALKERFKFADIIPTSAHKKLGLDVLLTVISDYLPTGVPDVSPDEFTDRPERFFAAEIVREKVFHLMGEEIPYGITVEIEKFNTVEGLRKIDATIVVSKSAYKGMIIGAQGAKLKSIGTKARVDMEKLFEGKVFLRLWVKVRKGWVDDSQSVKYFGYE